MSEQPPRCDDEAPWKPYQRPPYRCTLEPGHAGAHMSVKARGHVDGAWSQNVIIREQLGGGERGYQGQEPSR